MKNKFTIIAGEEILYVKMIPANELQNRMKTCLANNDWEGANLWFDMYCKYYGFADVRVH